MLSPFDTIPERDGQTDGRTEKIPHINIAHQRNYTFVKHHYIFTNIAIELQTQATETILQRLWSERSNSQLTCYLDAFACYINLI